MVTPATRQDITRVGLVGGNPWVTLDRAMTPGPMAGRLVTGEQAHRKLGDREVETLVRAQTYEITFLGQANPALRAEFEDCEVTVGHGTTTLRAEFPDQGALTGLMERINSLKLDVIDVSLVAPVPE